MKKFTSILLSTVMAASLTFGISSSFMGRDAYAVTVTSSRISIAEKLMNDLGKGKYKEGIQNYKYSQNLKSAMTEETLMMIMETRKLSTGEFKKIISSSENKVNAYNIVTLNVLYENSENSIVFSFNDKDELEGFYFARAKSVDDPTFGGQNIVFGGDKFKLNGTLNVPTQPTDTLVIVVHGSGANDRNLAIGPNKIYLNMAKDLTSKGIATFRYDKRNYTYGNEYYSGDTSIWGETIEDALYAAKYFRNNGQFKKIYIAGHSLGGYAIPMMDRLSKDVKIDGYISLAGSVATPLEDLVMYQVEYNAKLDGQVSPEENLALQMTKELVERVKKLTPESKYTPNELMGWSKEFWLSVKGYNPIEESKLITKPTLVLNGSRDFQVTKEQFEIYKNALQGKMNYTFKLYDGLNHLFLSGTGAPNSSEYFIKSNIDKQVTEDIANWIKKINTSFKGVKAGWNSYEGNWIYCDTNGFKTVGWSKIKDQWYYFNNDGDMKTGWINYKNQWYYLEKTGTMKTGWDMIDKDRYYFYSDGHMASNTVIDGYKIGSNGVAKK